MQFNGGFDDTQAEPGAADTGGPLGPEKRVEHAAQIDLGITDSVIAHLQDQFIAAASQIHIDRFTLGRIFYRVRKQIIDDMTYQAVIDQDI